MKKFVGGLVIASGLTGVIGGGAMALAGPASAAPLGAPVPVDACRSLNIMGSGGTSCDSDWAPDGSFTRCDTVIVLGFGGTNCYRMFP